MTAKRTKKDSSGHKRIYPSREQLENAVLCNDLSVRFLLANALGYLNVIEEAEGCRLYSSRFTGDFYAVDGAMAVECSSEEERIARSTYEEMVAEAKEAREYSDETA